MDRRCGTLLLALSFKHMCTSTANPVNVLNTVACTKRQTTVVLPPANASADFPRHPNRRGTNTRIKRQRKVNPLYNLSTASSASMMIASNVDVINKACKPPSLSYSALNETHLAAIYLNSSLLANLPPVFVS